MCTDSVSEVEASAAVPTAGGQYGNGAGLKEPEMHICLLRDTGAIAGRQPDGRDQGTGWTGSRDPELMDIWASRALGGISASLEGRCCGLAETEGLVERPDSGWLSSSSSSLSSFSSSSGPSESSASESWRSALLT